MFSSLPVFLPCTLHVWCIVVCQARVRDWEGRVSVGGGEGGRVGLFLFVRGVTGQLEIRGMVSPELFSGYFSGQYDET